MRWVLLIVNALAFLATAAVHATFMLGATWDVRPFVLWICGAMFVVIPPAWFLRNAATGALVWSANRALYAIGIYFFAMTFFFFPGGTEFGFSVPLTLNQSRVASGFPLIFYASAIYSAFLAIASPPPFAP